MEYVGIDLHKKESQICMLHGDGRGDGTPHPHRAVAIR
jgi:hypothetical protein